MDYFKYSNEIDDESIIDVRDLVDWDDHFDQFAEELQLCDNCGEDFIGRHICAY